jgi:hypothetical protein
MAFSYWHGLCRNWLGQETRFPALAKGGSDYERREAHMLRTWSCVAVAGLLNLARTIGWRPRAIKRKCWGRPGEATSPNACLIGAPHRPQAMRRPQPTRGETERAYRMTVLRAGLVRVWPPVV